MHLCGWWVGAGGWGLEVQRTPTIEFFRPSPEHVQLRHGALYRCWIKSVKYDVQKLCA